MIINSLLDTDLYKFTMMQVIFHQHKDATASYKFICRSEGVDFTPLYEAILREIDALCRLRLKPDELDYLKSLGFFKTDYLDYLATFSLDKTHIKLEKLPFSLTICGPWLNTILFETPLLAIISELYAKKINQASTEEEGMIRLRKKIDFLQQKDANKQFNLIEFGSRRRYSKAWHKTVLKTLIERLPEQLKGTSNVLFAKELDLSPSGTMAHEFLQAHQAFTDQLKDSQQLAFQCWLTEYPNTLGIALSDVISLPAFLKDFDEPLAKAYHGVRHDSGDPIAWGDALVNHYRALEINPSHKMLVFSNSLTFAQAIAIQNHFSGIIPTSFGIGTYLTHDLGQKHPDIVIKMISCNGQPVAKISDSPEKSVYTDEAYLQKLRQAFFD